MTFVDALFSTGRPRNPGGWTGRFAAALGVAITLGIVLSTTVWIVDLHAMTAVALGAMLCLAFLLVAPASGEGGDRDRVAWYDYAAAALSLATSVYFFVELQRIVERIALLDPLSPLDLAVGSILLLLVLEVTRRTTGLGLLFVVLGFLAYNLWGDALPGAFGHGDIGYAHFLDILVFTTDGIFGVPLRVALTYVFLFSLFGAVLHKAGGGEFFFNAAAALSGKRPGGPAKIAVVSSGLFGTLSGSPTSDVIVTGSVTIPMMRRLGYSGALAGGVEVAASTGGSLLPPVMGSAAFIMAEFTGIPYQSIVIAALVPALLYYVCIYFQVHLRSLKLGLGALDMSQVPPLRATMRQGGLFLVPLVVLIAALVAGYSPNLVAAYATVGVFGVALLRRETRLGLVAVLDVLAETARRSTPAVGACAAAGLVVGGISMTGLGAKFTDLIFLLAGQQLLWSLLIAAVVVILLGMGMPIPSVYILSAVLIAPALTKLGMSNMAANMFLLYYASLSAMTPPVAVAAFAAAPLAQANPLAIGMSAVRLSITAFIMPFAFAYSGELLLEGEPLAIALHLAAALGAVFLISIAVEGFFRDRLGPMVRIVIGGCGLALLAPDAGLQVAAAVIGAVSLLLLARRVPVGVRAGP